MSNFYKFRVKHFLRAFGKKNIRILTKNSVSNKYLNIYLYTNKIYNHIFFFIHLYFIYLLVDAHKAIRNKNNFEYFKK